MTVMIDLKLIGRLSVSINSAEAKVTNRKSMAILVLLCMSKEQRLRRGTIASTIWGDEDSKKTDNSFRQTLKTLRESFKEVGENFIHSNKMGELWIEHSGLTLDSVRILEDLDAGIVPTALQSMSDVASSYLSEFDALSDKMEMYVRFERTQFRRSLLDRLSRIFNVNPIKSNIRGDATQAMQNVDPTSELAARCRMQWCWERGEPLAGVKAYHELCEALDSEYGDAEPSDETTELLVRIKRGDSPETEALSAEGTGGPATSLPAATTALEIPQWTPAPVRPAVLVRRFIGSGDDKRVNSFATGFAKGLIGRLSRFRNLDVIGHASSFSIDQSISDPDAAKAVAARYVINGELCVESNRVSVTVELTNAWNNQVLYWDRFEEDVRGVFEIEREVEEIVASRMAINIELAERMVARARDPENLNAYSLVVSGWLEDFENGATGRIATERAMKQFSSALGFDRYYSAALAGAARAHSVQWRFGWSEDRQQSMSAAIEHALRAVDSDPNDATAHAELGYVSLYRREHDRSIAAYERAIELNPSNAEIIAFYADALRHNDQPHLSIPLFKRALKLNPLKPDIYLGNMAGSYFVLQNYDLAISTIRKMRQPLTAQRSLTAALMLSGRNEEGLREAEKLRAEIPNFDLDAWLVAVPDRNPDHSNLLREGLQMAGF